jgi:hypothetical protein
MLRRGGIDVVAFGPSLQVEDAYFLIRAYASLEDLERSEADFYSSDEWRHGPRNAILACLEHYTSVVIKMDDATVEALRTDLEERKVNMDDLAALTDLNVQFIGAFRQGSWELLEPILSPSFSYLDGETGEVHRGPAGQSCTDARVRSAGGPRRWPGRDRIRSQLRATGTLQPLRGHLCATGGRLEVHARLRVATASGYFLKVLLRSAPNALAECVHVPASARGILTP